MGQAIAIRLFFGVVYPLVAMYLAGWAAGQGTYGDWSIRKSLAVGTVPALMVVVPLVAWLTGWGA